MDTSEHNDRPAFAAARAACEAAFGAPVSRVTSAGAPRRPSLRVWLGDRSVIATRRRDPRRARLEAEVVRALHRKGAPVPEVLAFDGEWLIQEDLGRERLTTVLDRSAAKESALWMDRALASLASIHEAGRAAGLERRVVVLGSKRAWLERLFRRAHLIARQLNIAELRLPMDELALLLRVRDPWLVKWDARPANAIAQSGGKVAFFDWEHCGCRNRLDDVSWLLCDEYTPDLPQAEERLLDRHLPTFATVWGKDEARHYLAAYGTFHSFVRLSVILDRKGGGTWRDWQRCLAADTAGVTQDAALRVCRRARRWAGRAPQTVHFVRWLDRVEERIAGMTS